MTFFDSIILGIVEGLTEFLPVSSTGHLILVSHLLGLAQTEFVKSFEIAIQLGSIAAVLFVYWKFFLDVRVLKRLLVAFIPTGIVGFILYRFIKDTLIGDPVIVVWALALGGIGIILIERFHTFNAHQEIPLTNISYRQSFLVGCAQALSVIPGVSRSGATVMGGLLLKIPREAILTFSFLLAVPTMVAATAYDLYKTPEVLAHGNATLIAVGFIVSFAVAVLTIRFVLAFVRKYKFTPFGYYRIALALLFWLIVL